MQDRLPAKPSFYRYVLVLCCLNCVAATGETACRSLRGWMRGKPMSGEALELCAGALLLGSKVVLGYCFYGLAHWAYFALLPLVRRCMCVCVCVCVCVFAALLLLPALAAAAQAYPDRPALGRLILALAGSGLAAEHACAAQTSLCCCAGHLCDVPVGVLPGRQGPGAAALQRDEGQRLV